MRIRVGGRVGMALYAGQDLLPIYLLEQAGDNTLSGLLRSASIEFSTITLDHVPSLLAQPDPAILLVDVEMADEDLERLSFKYGVGCGNQKLETVGMIKTVDEDRQQEMIARAFRFDMGDYILAGVCSLAISQRLRFVSRQHQTLATMSRDKVEETGLVVDPVTSMPNWLVIAQRLNSLLDPFACEDGEPEQSHALVLLNIKRFKHLAAAYGPVECDRILAEIAGRVRYAVSQFEDVTTGIGTPIASRLQADEFVILVPGVREAECCLPLAELIVEQFRNPFEVSGEEIRLTPMLGIASGPDHGRTANALLRATHGAVLEVRESARDQINVYKAGGAENRADMFALESRIRMALQQGEIKTYYQPQVCLNTDRVMGMEALIRWHHPDDGLIFPDQFLPQVDEAGLNPDLDEYVLRRSVEEVASWTGPELEGLKLSVNMTPQTFETRDVVRMVQEVLVETGFDPRRLTLEITESTLMNEADLVKETMDQLQEIGVTLALDDFGVGYSSLSYLKDLNFDFLKIDKGFTFGLLQNRQDTAMVQAMINMGITLGMKIVVEGVEEGQQLDWMAGEGAASWQGYLCSKPIIGEDFRNFVLRGEYTARQTRMVV